MPANSPSSPKKHGSISRIAPNWVVVSDPAEEYTGSGRLAGRGAAAGGDEMFPFDQPVETVLSLRDNAKHGALRSKLLPGYDGQGRG